MVTLIIILLFFCLFCFQKGENYFLEKREMTLDKFDMESSSEDNHNVIQKELDRYWKISQICETCWVIFLLFLIASIIFEILFVVAFFGYNSARIEKKIDVCRATNATLEESIVDFLVHDVGMDNDAFNNEEIDLERSFDYALIYFMRHPELKKNEEFCKQFDLYQKNYNKIQSLESDMWLHDVARYMLFFG